MTERRAKGIVLGDGPRAQTREDFRMGCCMVVPSKVGDASGFVPPPPPPPVRNLWLSQVVRKGSSTESTEDVKTFKTFDEWKESFEPTKKKKEKEKVEPTEEEAAANKAKAQKMLSTLLDKVGQKIGGKLLIIVLTFVAKLLEGAEKVAREKDDDELAGLLNSLGAMVCTFRFRYKSKHKFRYIRREMIAPELVKRIHAFVEKTDAAAEEAASVISSKLMGLIKGETALTMAFQTVSKMPLVLSLQQKAIESLSEGEGGIKELREEDVEKAMNNILFMVNSKLQAAISGHGQLSDYGSLAIGMVLAGFQQSMRGSGILERVCSEINTVIGNVVRAVEVARKAKAVGDNVRKNVRKNVKEGEALDIAVDAEERYMDLERVIQEKVAVAMGVVKDALLGAEGGEEED